MYTTFRSRTCFYIHQKKNLSKEHVFIILQQITNIYGDRYPVLKFYLSKLLFFFFLVFFVKKEDYASTKREKVRKKAAMTVGSSEEKGQQVRPLLHSMHT